MLPALQPQSQRGSRPLSSTSDRQLRLSLNLSQAVSDYFCGASVFNPGLRIRSEQLCEVWFPM